MLGATYAPGIFSSLGGYADGPHRRITRPLVLNSRSVTRVRGDVWLVGAQASLSSWRSSLVPAVIRAQTMRWPEAVAALAAERARAETSVRLLKRHAGDDAAALSRGELAYAEAKADVDAVIAGLIVVLAQLGAPRWTWRLETRLTHGVQAREACCT